MLLYSKSDSEALVSEDCNVKPLLIGQLPILPLWKALWSEKLFGVLKQIWGCVFLRQDGLIQALQIPLKISSSLKPLPKLESELLSEMQFLANQELLLNLKLVLSHARHWNQYCENSGNLWTIHEEESATKFTGMEVCGKHGKVHRCEDSQLKIMSSISFSSGVLTKVANEGLFTLFRSSLYNSSASSKYLISNVTWSLSYKQLYNFSVSNLYRYHCKMLPGKMLCVI